MFKTSHRLDLKIPNFYTSVGVSESIAYHINKWRCQNKIKNNIYQLTGELNAFENTDFTHPMCSYRTLFGNLWSYQIEWELASRFEIWIWIKYAYALSGLLIWIFLKEDEALIMTNMILFKWGFPYFILFDRTNISLGSQSEYFRWKDSIFNEKKTVRSDLKILFETLYLNLV